MRMIRLFFHADLRFSLKYGMMKTYNTRRKTADKKTDPVCGIAGSGWLCRPETISCMDGAGRTRMFSVNLSGFDGSVYLSEIGGE